MMRRLVAASSRHPAARHHREHLARHHLDLHLRPGAVLGACGCLASANPRCGIRRGFISASSCPMSRISARRPRSRRWRNRRAIWRWSRRPRAARRGGSRWKRTARRRSSRGCRSSSAPIIRPRCRCSWSRASPTDAMVTEVEMWSVRVSGWNADIARALSPLAEIVAVPDTAFDGAALLVSDRRHQPREDQDRPDRGRRLGALIGPRRQPRNALYGAPERGSQAS